MSALSQYASLSALFFTVSTLQMEARHSLWKWLPNTLMAVLCLVHAIIEITERVTGQ